MRKLLLCIDCQYDFMDGGKLGVNGATKTMDNLVDYINRNKGNYDFVVCTVDFHPVNHCSFLNNVGVWPEHCLQFSKGAAIYEPLLNAVKGNNTIILTKGTNPNKEEYSIFKNEESCAKLKDLVLSNNIQEIDVVGIAYNYCVADTVKDGVNVLEGVKFKVLKDFCPAIPDGTESGFAEYVGNTENVIVL